MLIIRLVLESFRFAFNALRTNLMRTVLSLLGVTIGIFAIISVFTLVDSLQKNINSSFSILGTDNVLVMKWPWEFGPSYPWWEYYRRPDPTYDEYKYLSRNLTEHAGIAIYSFKHSATLKNKNNSSAGLNIIGVSFGYKDVAEFELIEGRYFSMQEAEYGSNVVLVGNRVASELFNGGSLVGQEIKIKGVKYTVIGVIKKEGESIIDMPSNDENVLIPFKSFSKIFRTAKYRGHEARISIKGMPDDPGQERLEGELRGLMRKKRGLKPKQKDDFAINRPTVFVDMLDQVFGVMHVAGWLIGSFSILVGGFGIANIMFVSVRERTSIIGIQKSLGAKNYFIMYQFLFESIFLSLFGGALGIFLVYLLTFMDLGTLNLVMTLKNVTIGLTVSAIIGTISGIVPAGIAARMDPVLAMRS